MNHCSSILENWEGAWHVSKLVTGKKCSRKPSFKEFMAFFFFELSGLLIQFLKTASLFSLGSTEGCNKLHVATRLKAACVRLMKIIMSESDVLNLPCASPGGKSVKETSWKGCGSSPQSRG